MRKLFYIDRNPHCTLWDNIWSARTIEQELEACKIETAPRTMFLTYLPKNGKIVDAGCGFGKWVIYLTKLGYDVRGIDNNRFVIGKLKEFESSLQVEYGDILNLKYPDNYFDAYISMGVIEHFENGPIPALEEANRVLKPKGLIFVSTPVVNIIRKIIVQPILDIIYRIYYILKKTKFFSKDKIPEPQNSKFVKNGKGKKKKFYHFMEYRFTSEELQGFLKSAKFKLLRTVPHDFQDSNNHCIGLGVDFPFLKTWNSVNFEMN
ncbi:MAG: class I SAM-dependent methyltransferase, partial [Candidatus Hodarchaeales archaeon]